MSRREDRMSDSKRHRSRFDREPSPKRSRTDGKPATERPHSKPESSKDHLSSDQKHHRRLQDALPLEAPSRHDAKVETGAVAKNSEDKTNGNQEGSKHSSDPAKVPRSRSYFQVFRKAVVVCPSGLLQITLREPFHDDRGSTRQDGRGFSRRTDRERGWWGDPKEQLNNRSENKMLATDAPGKEEKANNNKDHMWRHDGYFEIEANPKPPVRKRPSFSERKITTVDTEKADKSAIVPAAADPVMSNPQDRAARSDRRDEYSRHSDKLERPFARDRVSSRGEAWRGNAISRDRYAGSGRYGGRDQPTARQDYRQTGGGGRVEKWKHDLYNDTNRSPTPKNDDQISKIEALLAS